MSPEPPKHLPLAALVSAARQHQSLSLSAVAREMQRGAQEEGTHCGATRQTILGYERGRIPHPDALRWLAAALGLPIDTLAVAAKKQRTHRQQLRILASTQLIEVAHDPDGATLDEDMERRELLAFFSRAVKAGLLTSGLRHLPAVASPVPIDDGSIDAAVSISQTYRRLWASTPNHELIGPVQGHLRLISRFLASADAEKDQVRLATAASETALLAAWLAEDLWELDTAAEHYQAARAHAERSQNLLLQTYVLGCMSYWATRTEQGTQAVRLVGQAKHLLPQDAPPVAHAWIAVREATAYATAHDQPATLDALTRAERTLDKAKDSGETTWPWVFPMNHQEVSRYKGLAATRLQLFDIGIPALNEGLEAFTPATKRRAYTIGKLAEAHARTGDVEQACELGAEAFMIAMQFGDTESLLTVRTVRVRLEPMRTTQAVRDLDERLLANLLSLPPTHS